MHIRILNYLQASHGFQLPHKPAKRIEISASQCVSTESLSPAFASFPLRRAAGFRFRCVVPRVFVSAVPCRGFSFPLRHAAGFRQLRSRSPAVPFPGLTCPDGFTHRAGPPFSVVFGLQRPLTGHSAPQLIECPGKPILASIFPISGCRDIRMRHRPGFEARNE